MIKRIWRMGDSMDFTTWHDQKPSHPDRATDEVIFLERQLDVAIAEHDRAVDRYLAHGGKVEQLEMLRAGEKVTRLQDMLIEARHKINNPEKE